MRLRRLFWLIKKELRFYLRLFKDKRTPKISKILIVVALAYLIFPFDIIPDIIPFAGFVDELIIIPLLFYIATMFIPKDVVKDNREVKKKEKTKFENVQEGEIIN